MLDVLSVFVTSDSDIINTLDRSITYEYSTMIADVLPSKNHVLCKHCMHTSTVDPQLSGHQVSGHSDYLD